MKQKFRILMVEDNYSDAELIRLELLRDNIDFTSQCVNSREQFMDALVHFLPDIIICDQSLPQFDAFSAMKILKERRSEVPFVLTTGTLSDQEAIEYLRWGAYDYILKENLSRLPYSVKNALSKYELVQEKQSMEFEHTLLRRDHQVYAEKNKNITDSMIYAKGIQTALMPKQNFIHRYFPESFLINIPKDIVSGDFYWLSEYEDKIVIAVGDCTGHGVPGALISMMGYNKLNYIVNRLGETNPAKILDHLNFEIQEVFKQDDQEISIRDGMDIAICTIDKKNNLLQFSGANRPIYFIKNDTLEIIKGDKKCIGGTWHESVKFTNHTMKIDSIKSIYLFTDGFIDQFGGEREKKFMCRQFKDLLSSVHPVTMNDQKEILIKTLNDWKGDSEQTDDICVLGIRL